MACREQDVADQKYDFPLEAGTDGSSEEAKVTAQEEAVQETVRQNQMRTTRLKGRWQRKKMQRTQARRQTAATNGRGARGRGFSGAGASRSSGDGGGGSSSRSSGASSGVEARDDDKGGIHTFGSLPLEWNDQDHHHVPLSMEKTLKQMPRGRHMRVVTCLSDGLCFWRAVAKATRMTPACLMQAFLEYCTSHEQDPHILAQFDGPQDLRTDVAALRIYCGLEPCSDGVRRRAIENGAEVLDATGNVISRQPRWDRDWCTVRWGDASKHGPILAMLLQRPVVYFGVKA